jgi:hypothetical protein
VYEHPRRAPAEVMAEMLQSSDRLTPLPRPQRKGSDE